MDSVLAPGCYMLIEDISTSAVPALASSLSRLTVSGEQPAADELLLTVQTAEGGGSGLLLKISARMHTEQTALVYDERMCAHECPAGHPERPERIVELYKELNRLGFAEHCTPVPSRLVLREEVLLVHERRHWDRIEWAVGQELGAMKAFAAQHESVYLNNASLDAARCAAGSVLELTDRVVSGAVRNGMAVVRPPGHHAEMHEVMGFCLFNTIAIAARHARTALGCKRVLIVDWDIHHGNGIQHAFADDPSVLYFSVHRYEKGTFFPAGCRNSPVLDASCQAVGGREAKGTTVNVAWDTKGHKRRHRAYRTHPNHLTLPLHPLHLLYLLYSTHTVYSTYSTYTAYSTLTPTGRVTPSTSLCGARYSCPSPPSSTPTWCWWQQGSTRRRATP